jgi:transposase-like protein
LDTFPSSNPIGIAALAWAASGHRTMSTRVTCPRCGNPMTVAEELERKRQRRMEAEGE